MNIKTNLYNTYKIFVTNFVWIERLKTALTLTNPIFGKKNNSVQVDKDR